MADTYLHQFGLFMVLVLHVVCLQSATIHEFNIRSENNGQVELVCRINDIDENQWVAIYRYFGHYAECFYWEKTSLSNGPFSCTGDFEVTIERPAERKITYTVRYNLPISSPNSGDYFCRVLTETNPGEYDLDATALELGSPTNYDIDVKSYHNFPECTPRTTKYNPGDSVELSCSALGDVPATVQWKRNGKIIEGYPKTFNHGVDPGTSPMGIMEHYNKDGFILVTTKLTVTLTESDELSYYTCEMSSPNITSSCEIGPFTLETCEGTVTESPGNCTIDSPETVILGLDMWLFTTILACAIIGVLSISNIAFAICLHRARKRATYLLRKSSHSPIMAHDETEMENRMPETVPYDSANNMYVEDNTIQNTTQNGGQMNHQNGGHMVNRGPPYTEMTPDNPQESHYNEYPDSEFIYDWDDEALYSNQEVNHSNSPSQSNYGNSITPINHHSESFYENH